VARQLVDLGKPLEGDAWYGTRPCTPDMLPVLGPAPRHCGLWMNFGPRPSGLDDGSDDRTAAGRIDDRRITRHDLFISEAGGGNLVQREGSPVSAYAMLLTASRNRQVGCACFEKEQSTGSAHSPPISVGDDDVS